MNQDHFNMEIRKYLKKVGITSQREITDLVTKAISEGKLTGNETLKAHANITLQDLGCTIEIDGEITTFVERALNMIIGFLGEFLTLVGETVASILGRN